VKIDKDIDMNTHNNAQGGSEDLGIDVVKLPGDLQDQCSRLCLGRFDFQIRGYALEIKPSDRTLNFIRLLTYDEHLAVCFLINDGYHRQEAAALVYTGECGANEGDEGALIPKIVAGGEVIRIIGTITLDAEEWTIWRRNDAPRPRDPLLAFSVVRYDASSNSARPW
jgi:hypothetical protein